VDKISNKIVLVKVKEDRQIMKIIQQTTSLDWTDFEGIRVYCLILQKQE